MLVRSKLPNHERLMKAYGLGMVQDYSEGLVFRPDDLISVTTPRFFILSR
ncbi:hypothetical protein DFO62_12659 [Serratia fonticola]|nr:hypothetical protein DFO62_12659 [Serratia fonticola]